LLLAEDETDLLLFAPLRAAWSQHGEPAQVLLSGWNARQVVFGAMNLVTGLRLLQARLHQRTKDFQAFLHYVRQHYPGWHVTLLLDGDRGHAAVASQSLADFRSCFRPSSRDCEARHPLSLLSEFPGPLLDEAPWFLE
jgi:hypothetical protein